MGQQIHRFQNNNGSCELSVQKNNLFCQQASKNHFIRQSAEIQYCQGFPTIPFFPKTVCIASHTLNFLLLILQKRYC